jgi:hypothetical protein
MREPIQEGRCQCRITKELIFWDILLIPKESEKR